MAAKSGDERLKEMEAEMALFEQEVLGGPVPLSGSPHVMEQVPVALAVSAVPMVRPIIGTNTYRQVQQTLEAQAASFVGPPPPTFMAPGPPSRPPPPILRPAFVPHILQRPGGQRLPMMRGPPVAPPLPRPPPPPPMMMPPPLQGPILQGPSQSLQHMGAAPQVPDMVSMAPSPRSMAPLSMKPSPSVIQAAPTVYSAPPVTLGHKKVDARTQRQARMEELAARVAEQQAVVTAAGLLDRKDSDDSNTVIGPSMPEPEPPHPEPVESVTEDKKKGKSEKVKKCIRTAAGTTWEDQSLLEWESDDFRIFCGDLGNEVNDDILARAFSRYPSFLKAKVVRDKRTGKTKGYGFVSFKDPNDYVRAMREMNGKYVGSRPIKLRKSMWRDRNIDVVRKKQKEKKKLGLR
ncbi:RNA-binding protein 42 [Oryzias latipes]|uniref:RNA-binding protein 42 n=1 Tax=Oryzias latipes TaxID=8090 RepID=H2LE43_ORYLA|nr:RNA-binding protein 42 [Oryzias latipes]